jgi:predicted oxidoreductase
MVGCASGTPTEENKDTEGAAKTEQTVSNATPIDALPVPAQWDREADVVVVGAGGGGLTAAVRARQENLSIIVVEKLNMVGGNTQSATMFSVPGGTAAQDAREFAVPSYPFSPEKWTDFMINANAQSGNPEMYRTIATNVPLLFNWITEALEIDNWALAAAGSYYTVAPLGLDQVTNKAYEVSQKMGAEYMLGSLAQALVKDGDRVVGVKIKDNGGNDLYLHATKGVVLCGGGFAANKELLAEYCPAALDRAAACFLSSSDQGEPLRMALGAGAEVVHRDSFAIFDGGMDWKDFGGEWCHYLYDGATQLVRQPWLSIDATGQRIRYIPSNKPGALTDQAAIETATPGNRSYIVFDSKWDEYALPFEQKACRTLIKDGVDRQPFVPEYYQDYHAGVQDAIDTGIIRKCDTLDELAESLGLDADVVKRAVENWNKTCEAGEDDFMYPLDPVWLHPVAEPPFYGAKIGGNLFLTGTGVAINPKMQVLDTKSTPIPGLYASWYTAAGAFAPSTMVSMRYSPCGVTRSFLGGYLAIETIANEEI